MANEISVERRPGGVALLTLDAPERRNALTVAMADELVAACEALDADPEVGAVVVRGEGGFFCAGGDRATLDAAGRDPADPEVYAGLGAVYRSFARVGELEAPTVAAVRGGAVGAGLNLMLATDLRIVAARREDHLAASSRSACTRAAATARCWAAPARARPPRRWRCSASGSTASAPRSSAWPGSPWTTATSRRPRSSWRPAREPTRSWPAAPPRSLRTVLGPPALPWPAALELERASQMWSMRRKALG